MMPLSIQARSCWRGRSKPDQVYEPTVVLCQDTTRMPPFEVVAELETDGGSGRSLLKLLSMPYGLINRSTIHEPMGWPRWDWGSSSAMISSTISFDIVDAVRQSVQNLLWLSGRSSLVRTRRTTCLVRVGGAIHF